MLTIHELLGEVDHLPDTDKWQLVKHVLDSLELAQTTPASTADYHQFLRETYGILSDTPIKRWEQGERVARRDPGGSIPPLRRGNARRPAS